ncbi:MAG: hypothetical protein HY718_19485 [Planctomycetes bacterium]|nr:hypothetical protein [Planctomycetota bacterium]
MSQFDLNSAVADMRSIALSALPRMYRPDQRLFAFRLRRRRGMDVLEGISRRYTAIVLIGLAGESETLGREILHGNSREEICGGLLDAASRAEDPGEVALTLWAARVLGHPRASVALERLRSMRPDDGPIPTVELAWSLAALAMPGSAADDEALTRRIADRLMASFREVSGLFPHYPEGACPSRFRAHVCCYADLAYPIQALSAFYLATGDERAIDMARRCATRMCELQGSDGQWWWHYDVRTGQVLERFPVYAVHQDGMGPMALLALERAGGDDHTDSIKRGVRWLYEPPELDGSLIDREAQVIWRKVARREPRKLARRLQAAVSSVHSSLRAPGVELLFPPRSVDYETRPYHMGWILHAFAGDRSSWVDA